METVISQSIETPNDPRKQELEELERQMALIKQKAISQVRCELYVGLGFLILQTLGFIRLTFWELSWDVMEPICFFVTSFHFALAYMFFLKTSINPTFKGYFQWRVKAKQMKLAHVHKFDYERYHELCNATPEFSGWLRHWAYGLYACSIRCWLVGLVWSKILGWCNALGITFLAVKEVLFLLESWPGVERYKALLHAIFLSSLWGIWKARNDRIFSGKRRCVDDIVKDIKMHAFLWIKIREKGVQVSWSNWCMFQS
ncbi:hypothetical protein QVD17_16034 [Tagetes erecta]|uniref:Calcium uniporter protein C-terminal domain-containing protein n=1 Tax=Tagetes erecta TaxID=13708 RepID=A0AAD8P094_TARER|nr:hypothetical protein QVD17_16034 [Tagetes erecta]